MVEVGMAREKKVERGGEEGKGMGIYEGNGTERGEERG